MPDSVQDTFPDRHPNDQRYEPLWLALGRAVMYWAAVEHQLGVWLARIARVEDQAANDIFFALGNFRSRLDVLKAAATHSKMSPKHRELFDAVAKKVDAWSKFRNSFVHGMALEARDPLGIPTQMIVEGSGEINREKLARGITAKMLEQASVNFVRLTNILMDAEGIINSRKTKQLPELLARVEQLPNVLASSELSRRQKGRERQRRAAAPKSARPKKSGKAG
jgi:hypothetical protein